MLCYCRQILVYVNNFSAFFINHLLYFRTINLKSMSSVCLLPVLILGRNWNKQICLQWHWQRLHSVLLLRHQDRHQHREEPQGRHWEQCSDRVHAVRLVVRRVCVCRAGGSGQGDHCPVHQEPGRVHEDLWQHQPVHDQDEGELGMIITLSHHNNLLPRSRWRRLRESKPGASLRGTLRKVSTSERFSSIYPERWWQTSPSIYISKPSLELSFSTAVIPASWRCWSVNWSQSSSCRATTFARKYWPFH